MKQPETYEELDKLIGKYSGLLDSISVHIVINLKI